MTTFNSGECTVLGVTKREVCTQIVQNTNQEFWQVHQRAF